MQLDGDAGLEVRVPVTAGPHVVGVSFVRELWEPEGLPQPLQRGRVITERPGLHGLRERRLGPDRRPVQDRRAGARTRRAVARSSSASPRLAVGRAGLRDEDPFADGAARVSPAGDERGRPDAARVLRHAAGATAAASTPGFSSRSSGCSSIRISCCASIGIRPRRHAAPTATAPIA